MSCAADPEGWRSEHAIDPDIVVSGECLSLTNGTVVWTSGIRLTGRLSGDALVRGPCPLVTAAANSIIDGVAFECTSGAAAVDVVGENVRVTGTASGGALVRAVNVRGVNVDGLRVTGQTAGQIVAVFGHTNGDIAVECTSEQTVVRQPLDGTATYGPLCRPVDIQALMGLFGRRYEVQFYHKDVFADTDNSLLTVLAWTAFVGAGAVLTLHEDAFWRAK
jgi:hypothetical protein